jgi:hypothetical protein
MIDGPIQYIGGTMYPAFESLILLTILLITSSTYFGLNYEATEVSVGNENDKYPENTNYE